MKGSYRKLQKGPSQQYAKTKTLAIITAAMLSALAFVSLRSPMSEPILLYIPIHYTSIDKLDDFLGCFSGRRSIDNPLKAGIDVLVLTNGDRGLRANESKSLEDALSTLSKHLPYASKVRM